GLNVTYVPGCAVRTGRTWQPLSLPAYPVMPPREELPLARAAWTRSELRRTQAEHTTACSTGPHETSSESPRGGRHRKSNHKPREQVRSRDPVGRAPEVRRARQDAASRPLT